jgi:hypothetical protein
LGYNETLYELVFGTIAPLKSSIDVVSDYPTKYSVIYILLTASTAVEYSCRIDTGTTTHLSLDNVFSVTL